MVGEMLEAKDTVMTVTQILEVIAHMSQPQGHISVLKQIAKAQAEISFEAGKESAQKAMERAIEEENMNRPTIVCLCGSTRFVGAFRQAQLEETLAGKIVLTIGCNMRSDTEIFGHLPEAELSEIKRKQDELHLRRIDLADEVLILNVGDYIGDSTKREIEYAQTKGKRIRWLVPSNRNKERNNAA